MSNMNVLMHNMPSLFSNRQLGITTDKKAKSSEKLSSGYKINRAADDAAGLTISEKLRHQIRGLTQASKNSQDGISLIRIADGALEEVTEMLQRGNELSIKAANGTLTDQDREAIDKEITQLKAEIDRCATSTSFNTLNLFPPKGAETEIKTIIGSCAASIGQQAHTLSFFGEGDCACPRCGTVLSVEQAGLWD